MYTMFSKLIRKVASSTIMVVVIFSLCAAPFNHKGEVQRAEALAVTVLGGPGTIQETLSAAANSIIAGLQQAFNIKEFVLDGLAHQLAQMILRSMVQSIVNWINSGFKGKPAFVTDIKQHLLNLVDQKIGEYIYEDPALNFLCSPFQLDVKIALAMSYQDNAHDNLTEAQCTLSEVTDNVEGFLNGDFANGGWSSWFELTQNPGNTPTGAYLAAETEMYARIVDAQGREVQQLDWGDGFLSFKVCDVADAKSGREKNCTITTPGSVISDQINKALGAPQDSLITADEINEIITALFRQLALKAIGGLRGLSGSGYGESKYGSTKDKSYLDALVEPEDTSSLNPFERTIKNEKDYIAVQDSIIDMVNEVETYLKEAKSSYPACTSLLSELPVALTNIKAEAVNERLLASTTIATLVDLKSQFEDSTDPEEQIELVNALQSLETGGTLHNEAEVTMAKYNKDYIIKEDINTEKSKVASHITSCEFERGR